MRLLGEYEQAFQDFKAVEHLNNHETEAAARYLRDTAENALMCLEGTDVDPHKLQEIEQTYHFSKGFVQDVSGKIRKFDPGWQSHEQQRGTPARSDRARSRQQRSPYRYRHAVGPDADLQAVSAYQSRPHVDLDAYGYVVEDSAQRRRSRSPTRDNERYDDRGNDPIGNGGRGGYNVGIRIKGNGTTEPPLPPHGRGHSGVPYGYREHRVVDSYRPGA